MTERISETDAAGNLGAFIERISKDNDEFVIERDGKPVAALVPVRAIEQMRKAARMRLKEILEKNQQANKAASSTEEEKLARRAVAWARKRK